MRRPRLPYTLSIIQFSITAILTLCADRVDWLLGEYKRIPGPYARVHLAVIDLRKIWRGINAPLFPINLSEQKPFLILGLSVFELIYLFSVAVLWYYVGLAYERATTNDSTGRRPFLGSFFVAWGTFMLFLAFWQIPDAFPWTFAYGRIFLPVVLFTAVPYLAWSLILIVSGAKRLRHSS